MRYVRYHIDGSALSSGEKEQLDSLLDAVAWNREIYFGHPGVYDAEFPEDWPPEPHPLLAKCDLTPLSELPETDTQL